MVKRKLALLLLLPALAIAMFIQGEKVPIERLIANVKAHLPLYPDQAEAQYLLGRLESLAFSGKADAVEVLNRRNEAQVPQVTLWSWVQENSHDPGSESKPSPQAQDFFSSSIEHYRQALALDPQNALYHFSMGWMAEQGQRYRQTLGPPSAALIGSDGSLSWQLLAVQEYRRAFSLASRKTTQIGPGPTVALQAGQALIAVLKSEVETRKAASPTAMNEAFIADAGNEIESVNKEITRLHQLPVFYHPSDLLAGSECSSQ